MTHELIVRVALDYPLPILFDYRCAACPTPQSGQLAHVPFGKRHTVGLVCEVATHSEIAACRLRAVDAIWTDCPPLSDNWQALLRFAASYYQRSFGEVALSCLPQALRDARRWNHLLAPIAIYRLLPSSAATLMQAVPLRAAAMRRLAVALEEGGALTLSAARALYPKAERALETWRQNGWVTLDTVSNMDEAGSAAPSAYPLPADTFAPTVEQADALRTLCAARGFAPFLLHGVTGSGKTEVYLRMLAALLTREPSAQALVLVPEINLTPQFETALRTRFAAWPASAIAILHSGLSEGERARHWLAAHTARARIVLGTRLAALASLPQLALIIVDEEHDAAYKQQERLRYSARDLAIWRAKQLNIPIVLGSATPSLETWQQAMQGRYTRLNLTKRARAAAVLPTMRLIDINAQRRQGDALMQGLSAPFIAALSERLAHGEQSLVFLNRRGYAPALTCGACGWVAACPRCSVYVVLHKPERAIRCHHCGWRAQIPLACPVCGNLDLAPLGRGTQRIEEALAAVLPAARILRIDKDSTRRKGSAKALFAEVHAGDVDILVGTQMISKGHDFKRITLVGILNADAALFSHDFRAGERLFAQLMQVSGRAGRSGRGEVFIQTRYPQHPLYQALADYDYARFANAALGERRAAKLPPFVYQALLRAESRTLDAALTFLAHSAAALDGLPDAERVICYEPVPMTVVKVMDVHRAQLLVESVSRSALQNTLHAWQPRLRTLKGVLRWSIEVDPLEV